MKTSAVAVEHESAEPALPVFLTALSDLCRKYGFGIAGEPELFVLEPEDYAFNYSVDDRGHLVFGD
jgi:hypothetical protein